MAAPGLAYIAESVRESIDEIGQQDSSNHHWDLLSSLIARHQKDPKGFKFEDIFIMHCSIWGRGATPIEVLHAETTVPPIQEHLDLLQTKARVRLRDGSQAAFVRKQCKNVAAILRKRGTAALADDLKGSYPRGRDTGYTR